MRWPWANGLHQPRRFDRGDVDFLHTESQLEIEAMLSNRDIGFVHSG
jgi:hemolysin D